MTTAYVILEKGMDYNDEIYSVGWDDARVEKTGYKSLDEAKVALKQKYLDLFSPDKSRWGYHVGDFGYGDEPGWELVDMVYDDEETDEFDRYRGPLYSEAIERAENQGLNWLPVVPQLYEIVEVTF